MNEKESLRENLPLIRSSIQNSASENHFNRNNSLSSRFGESLPIMNNNNQQITQIGSNLSRFPDDFTNLNDEDLDITSPLILSTGQNNTNGNHHSPSYVNIQTEQSEQTNNLSRWEDAWDEYEKQNETNEIPPKDEKIHENVDILPLHPINTSPTVITRVYVREFLPQSTRDPTFSILRNLFVRSFDEFYKQIETQLNLKSDKNLIQWLDETYDEEQESILKKEYRCFLLCGNENQDSNEIILGFLTLKEEEEGSIYIAQVAVRLDIKRRGYGAQLLQHLRNIYPPNTQYWGLCRRANRPALQFYLKQGAKFMKNDEVAQKYGYDPSLYAGFEFVDTVPVITSPVSILGRMKPNPDNSDHQPIIDGTQTIPNSPPTNDTQQILKSPKKKRRKIFRCCTTS